MLQQEILYKRNLFVYYTMLVIFLIYITMIAVGIFENIYFNFLNFIVVSSITIGLLFIFKIDSRITQFSILFSWNISAILIILASNELITFFWFVCILILSIIYRSPILSMILLSIMSFETIVVLKLFYEKFLMNTENDQYVSSFFILMIILMNSFQIIIIRKIWGEKERTSLNREFELTSKEGYLQLFFENADDAIAVFDLDSKIIDVNPAFEKLYGWSREESLGKSLPLLPPQNIEAGQERYNQLLQGDSLKPINTQDMRKDGTLINVQITLSPIYNHHGEIIASSVISRDMSYQMENERLTVQSEKLKIVGEMAAGLAHEIRNPMTVISGFVQMMNADEKSPYKNYTTLIQTEIERINLIISEFLVLAKPQKEEYTKFSTNEVLESIIELFSLENKQKNIIITNEMNGINTYIEGNFNKIKQVFINLIKNAIEAIDSDGKIHIEQCFDNGFVYIYIKDNGIGISAHVLERIFEPFYTTKTEGTGLGMVITNKIIQDHKGNIKIRSTEKIGTEILIQLPCVEVEEISSKKC